MKLSYPKLASLLQTIGDVIPFGKRSLYANPMTEMGAKPYEGGAGVVGRIAPSEKPQWEVYANNGKFDSVLGPFTREQAGEVLKKLKSAGVDVTHGYLGNGRPVDEATKYKRATYLQRFLSGK